jgi:hypothetical protein
LSPKRPCGRFYLPHSVHKSQVIQPGFAGGATHPWLLSVAASRLPYLLAKDIYFESQVVQSGVAGVVADFPQLHYYVTQFFHCDIFYILKVTIQFGMWMKTGWRGQSDLPV